MLLLVDIGNTHTHLGLGGIQKVFRQADIRTTDWKSASAARKVAAFVGREKIEGCAFCSVVPEASARARGVLTRLNGSAPLELNAATVRCVGIDYPKPETIGPDRLANAVAARHYFGAPSLVVDFGTAVTFDIVNRAGDYIGGVIAPGLAAMTDYLHEKTALLPRIKIAEVDTVIGKSTAEAMRIGAVHGYRGLIRGLLHEIKSELKARRLRVVATGGCAKLIASKIPEITAVDPLLTLEGLRIELRFRAL